MQDKEVGELWRIYHDRENPDDRAVRNLIRKLVEERAENKRRTVMALGGNDYRPTRFRGGKKEPNPYYKFTDKDWRREALHDFDLREEEWE